MEAALNYLWVIPLAWLFWKIRQCDNKDFITRDQIEKLIKDRNSVVSKEVEDFESKVEDRLEKFERKIDRMSDTLGVISVTVARIDERIKRDV